MIIATMAAAVVSSWAEASMVKTIRFHLLGSLVVVSNLTQSDSWIPLWKQTIQGGPSKHRVPGGGGEGGDPPEV